MTLFDDIKAGLTEAIAIAEGDADPTTYRVHVQCKVDVAAIRRKQHLTQADFSAAYGFPIGTIREWEQGRSRPDTSARAYLMVIAREPEIVREILRRNPDSGGTERRAMAPGFRPGERKRRPSSGSP